MLETRLYRVLNNTFVKDVNNSELVIPKGVLIDGKLNPDTERVETLIDDVTVRIPVEYLELVEDAVAVDGDDGLPPDVELADVGPPGPIPDASFADVPPFMAKLKEMKSKVSPPTTKKYPVVKFKKTIKKADDNNMPFDIPAGTEIDINALPQVLADALMQLLKILPSGNEHVDIVYPESKQPPPTLSDAIKQGSKDSEQLIGGWFDKAKDQGFDPALPIIFQSSPIFATTSGKHIVESTPHKIYSSFEVGGNEPPMAHKQSLFTNALGQGYKPMTASDTNMFVYGMMPLGKKFTCTAIQVYTSLPVSSPGVHTFLSGASIQFRTPVMEIILGTLGMYVEGQQFYTLLESGMDFTFNVTWEREAQVDLHNELKDPWWMQYVPADKKTAPRSLKVWLVMHGMISSPI